MLLPRVIFREERRSLVFHARIRYFPYLWGSHFTNGESDFMNQSSPFVKSSHNSRRGFWYLEFYHTFGLEEFRLIAHLHLNFRTVTFIHKFNGGHRLSVTHDSSKFLWKSCVQIIFVKTVKQKRILLKLITVCHHYLSFKKKPDQVNFSFLSTSLKNTSIL